MGSLIANPRRHSSMPHYRKIGSGFWIGSVLREFHGPAIISDDAIILIVDLTTLQGFARVFGGLGGGPQSLGAGRG